MNNYPVLISIPHSSVFVPAWIRKEMNLTDHEIAAHADLATDQIFDVPYTYQVKSGISRLVVDPNRAPDDIEMEAKLGEEGVVVAISEDKKPIYTNPPTIDQVVKRVDKYHNDFHDAIELYKSKTAFLIDGHSCKSTGPATKPDAGKTRADVIVGNRDYTTCSREMTIFIAQFFRKEGFSVNINNPYKGKYVLGYHCSRRFFPGVQIEFNRSVYMNERTLHIRQKDVSRLNQMVSCLVEKIAGRL